MSQLLSGLDFDKQNIQITPVILRGSNIKTD